MSDRHTASPFHFRRYAARLASVPFATAWLAVAMAPTAVPAQEFEVVEMMPLPPDPCWPTMVVLGWEPEVDHIDVSGEIVDVYQDPSAPSPLELKKTKPLALIVNGNGYFRSDYADLASHLVRSGFIAAVVKRPGGGVDGTDFVLEALPAVLEHIDQIPGTPVALIGHSVGGGAVVEAAVRNQEEQLGFNIGAVVGLAPNVNFVETHLDVEHVPAYLLIYGSQDQDVNGLGLPHDAFAAYDLAGTEGSTTCHGGLCFVTPGLDRTMLFVHGADHSGLINKDPSCPIDGCPEPFNNFLARSDQFCIAKGYVEAFLHWTLADNSIYHRMVRGTYRPPSIQSIVSAGADELGNPAGSPLRMFFQVSPAKRSVIENFEDGAWTLASGTTPGVFTEPVEPGEYAGEDANIRHLTRLLLVGWTQNPSWQLLGFRVPKGRRDVTSFTHVALRTGQVSSLPTADFENPPNASQPVLLGLVDGHHSSWQWLDPVPPNDERPNGKTHSVMSTFAERLTAFSGIDKTNIEAVYLAFPADTQGTLMIDSLEWFRDN